MADYYVYSGATGTGTGANWTNAFTSIVTALLTAVGGDNVWTAHDHAFVGAAAGNLAYTSAGTVFNPVKITCVNRAVAGPGFVPSDYRTTATETSSTTGNPTFGGAAYSYGVTYISGTSTNANVINFTSTSSTVQVYWIFDNGALRIAGSGTTGRINFGAGTQTTAQGKVILKNSSFQFNNAAQGIKLQGINLEWINGSITGATLPTTLFVTGDVLPSRVRMRNIDLSLLGTGKTLFGAFSCGQDIHMSNCKTGASVTIAAAQTDPGVRIELIVSDNSTANNRYEVYTATGTEVTETSINLTSGESDGTNPITRKITTTANCGEFVPFEPLVFVQDWIDVTGSPVTLTVELINDGTTFKDNEIALDIEYMGDAVNGTPLGSPQSSYSGPFATGNNIATSTAVWNNTGGMASPVKQKLSQTFTPQLKGTYRGSLRFIKPSISTPVYVGRVP